jgi:hypothetical protein
MELFRLRDDDQDAFAEAPENGMDLHYAQTRGGDFYLVIGCRVAILLNERTYSEPDTSYLYQPWAGSGLSDEGRIATFERWLSSLRGAPSLITTSAASAAPAFWSAMGMVTPIGTLPPPPPRPASIYGHLPFQVTTGPGALIYRWEAGRRTPHPAAPLRPSCSIRAGRSERPSRGRWHHGPVRHS